MANVSATRLASNSAPIAIMIDTKQKRERAVQIGHNQLERATILAYHSSLEQSWKLGTEESLKTVQKAAPLFRQLPEQLEQENKSRR